MTNLHETLRNLAKENHLRNKKAAVVTDLVKNYFRENPEKILYLSNHLRNRYSERYNREYNKLTYQQVNDMTLSALLDSVEIIVTENMSTWEDDISISVKLYSDYDDYYGLKICRDDDNVIVVATIMTEECIYRKEADYNYIKTYGYGRY